jgi:H+/Cl- antiporter ClcA
VTEQAGGYAESKDLTLRVTVRRKAPWAWLVLGALALLLVAVGLWWLRSRTAARGGG